MKTKSIAFFLIYCLFASFVHSEQLFFDDFSTGNNWNISSGWVISNGVAHTTQSYENPASMYNATSVGNLGTSYVIDFDYLVYSDALTNRLIQVGATTENVPLIQIVKDGTKEYVGIEGVYQDVQISNGSSYRFGFPLYGNLTETPHVANVTYHYSIIRSPVGTIAVYRNNTLIAAGSIDYTFLTVSGIDANRIIFYAGDSNNYYQQIDNLNITSYSYPNVTNTGCGYNIAESTTLTSDLTCGLTDPIGLRINTSNVVLDCNGHIILGGYNATYQDYGVGVEISNKPYGYYNGSPELRTPVTNLSNITIKNCNLSGWGYGILVGNGTNNVSLDSNSIYANTAVFVQSATNTTITNSNFTPYVCHANCNWCGKAGNVHTNQGQSGVWLFASNSTTISHTRFTETPVFAFGCATITNSEYENLNSFESYGLSIDDADYSNSQGGAGIDIYNAVDVSITNINANNHSGLVFGLSYVSGANISNVSAINPNVSNSYTHCDIYDVSNLAINNFSLEARYPSIDSYTSYLSLGNFSLSNSRITRIPGSNNSLWYEPLFYGSFDNDSNSKMLFENNVFENPFTSALEVYGSFNEEPKFNFIMPQCLFYNNTILQDGDYCLNYPSDTSCSATDYIYNASLRFVDCNATFINNSIKSVFYDSFYSSGSNRFVPPVLLINNSIDKYFYDSPDNPYNASYLLFVKPKFVFGSYIQANVTESDFDPIVNATVEYRDLNHSDGEANYSQLSYASGLTDSFLIVNKTVVVNNCSEGCTNGENSYGCYSEVCNTTETLASPYFVNASASGYLPSNGSVAITSWSQIINVLLGEPEPPAELVTCGGIYNTTGLNFSTFFESNSSAAEAYQEGTFYYYNSLDDYSVRRVFSSAIINYSWPICIYPSYAEFLVDSVQIYATPDGRFARYYFLLNASVSNVTSNVSLFLADNSSQLVQIFLRNGIGAPQPNFYISFQRQFLASNSSQEVAKVLTSASGDASAWLVANSVLYNILVYNSSGSVVASFANQVIPCASLTSSCQITIYVPTDLAAEAFQALGSTQFSCALTNSSANCTFIDTSGIAKNFTLVLTKHGSLSNYEVCRSSLATSSGSLYCNATDWTYGTRYSYNFWGKFGDPFEVPFENGWLPSLETPVFGLPGLLIVLLLALTMGLVGAWNPVVSLGFGLLVLIMSLGIGLLPSATAYGAVLGFAVVVIMLAVKMN